jgi:transcriptional regulator with XRE-family HTH domain
LRVVSIKEVFHKQACVPRTALLNNQADKLDMSVNGYANIERGETDVQISRLEQIADTFGMDLLELLNFGEKNVLYLTADNSFNHCKNNLQSTDLSDNKKELEHELEKARLLLQQKDKEIAYLNDKNNDLKDIISLVKKESSDK